MVLLQRELYFPKDRKGGGVQLFPGGGGIQMLISI